MTFLKNISIIFIFSCISTNSFAQYITVTDTYTAKELIENVLINSPCASVSNFSVSGGFFGGQESFGYFSDNSRNFPFTDGIILSTGKAVSATGPNNSILSEGDTSWSGDTDLQEALGVNNTINATVLEFDFVPLTNKISFDYIFSSEQYLSNPSSNQCNYTDGFAFLLKDLTNSGSYQNLALIPNTTIPVRINTVRGSGTVCPAANEAFFGGFNGTEHPTNFNGQTAVMKAQATVIPGNSYHIKLVVADQGNNLYDSAIFLGGGSFKFEKDLGPNRLLATNNPICEGNNYTLDATEAGSNSYKWFKDDVDTGITTPTFLVTEAGKYKSEITIGTTTCKAIGEVTIEYAALPILTNTTSVQCDEDKDGFGLFNLTKLDNIIKNNSNIGNVLYYQELSDAENQNTTKAITGPERYLSKTKTIYASVSNAYGCNAVASVILQISNNKVSSFHDLESCDLDDKIDGFYTFDLSKADPKILSGLPSGLIVEYYETLNDALLQNNILSNNYRNTTRFEMTIYAKVLNGSDCYGIIPLRLFVNSNSPKNFGDETIQLCEGGSKKLQVSTNFINYEWSNGDKNYFTEVKAPGNYSVTVADSNTCLATKKFTVISSGKATITNVEINDFKESQNSVLIYYIGTGEYEFSIDGTFFQDSPLFDDVPVGEYTIRVRDKNGCGETTKKIYVLNYPKFFTPNGDSYNDIWTIQNIDIYPKSVISIFDRYGKLIYQFKGNKKGWDGKLNSKDLPSTDYWFVITLENDKIVKGHFTLLR